MIPKVYFHSGFWKSINSNTTREGIRTMLNVSDVLSNSIVVTDATEELIIQDPFLMIMIRQGKYIRCDDKYIDKKLDSLRTEENTEDLCATYLLNKKSEECDRIEKKYGVVALCSESLPNKNYLFKGDGFCMDKAHRYNQRYLTYKEVLRKPCNSMIIIDPYILYKKPLKDIKTQTITIPGISYNLESLLDAILPHELIIKFHLTIISCLENPKDIKTVYEKLKKCVKRIRPELDVALGLIYTETGYHFSVESFHSRHILTNSFIVDSEDGLDLFNEKGFLTKNNPTVSIVFPRLFGNSRQDFSKYEKWIKSVQVHVGDSKTIYGSKENRLFDLVK